MICLDLFFSGCVIRSSVATWASLLALSGLVYEKSAVDAAFSSRMVFWFCLEFLDAGDQLDGGFSHGKRDMHGMILWSFSFLFLSCLFFSFLFCRGIGLDNAACYQCLCTLLMNIVIVMKKISHQLSGFSMFVAFTSRSKHVCCFGLLLRRDAAGLAVGQLQLPGRLLNATCDFTIIQH